MDQQSILKATDFVAWQIETMLDTRFTALEAKVDVKLDAVEGELDTNRTALDMRFSGFQKKVEDLETKLGILEATSNKLEAIIRDLATKFGDINTEVTSNKELSPPFSSWQYQSTRLQNESPHIRTIADLDNIASITVQAYLNKYGVPFDDLSE